MSLPENIKNRLLEHFGDTHLPEDLAAILESDPEAHAFWDELHALDQAMPEDDAFYLEGAEFDAMLERVETEIDTTVEHQHLQAVTRPWYRITAVAASIALMAVAVMLSLEVNHPANNTAMVTTTTATETDTDSTVLIEPTEATTTALISDFTAQQSASASEWLLDDLTEEEFEYLQENFQVGDLL